jgi:colanic acid/amylovoran biosynthesis glycosyltransferase
LWTIFHGSDLSAYIERRGARAYDELWRRGDRFFAVSFLWIDRLKQLGCPADRIELLRMGIDVAAIPFCDGDFDLDRGLRILSVGRLVEKKGVEFALRALAKLRYLRSDLRWSYKIIGEGPLKSPLANLAKDLGIADRVDFAGKRSAAKVRDELAQTDIFMLPSVTGTDGDMEGIPVSLMEAMAAGVPVLSTYHSGIPELVQHRVSGLLSPERDPVSLVQNLCSLIDEPSLRPSLVCAARSKVESEFNQSIIAERLASRIKDELASQQGRRSAESANP